MAYSNDAIWWADLPIAPADPEEGPEEGPEEEPEDEEDPDLARMGGLLASTEEHLDRAEDAISALYWLAKLGQIEPPGTPAFDLSTRMLRAVRLYGEGEDLSDAVEKLHAEYRMRSRAATRKGGE